MTIGRRGWRELALVALGYGLATILLIWPLAVDLGSVARVDSADARLLIWNVAWVARTLVVDPLHVFDANIFHPHRWTLAYSESNLGAGVVAIPVYWATRNPIAAHNFAVLFSFVLSGSATYYLVRYLAGDRRAAAVAGLCFAFCPYVFGHLAHVHLLMTAGLPLSLLAFHRLADRPSPGRGAALGAVMAAQAFFCGYYAVFAVLTIGYAVLAVSALERRWTDVRYWTAVATAAGVAGALALPLFVPYLQLQRSTGFGRTLDEARLWSAEWRTYFASSARAHEWMLRLIGRWGEPLFPGFVVVGAGAAGLGIGWRAGGRLRRLVILYGGLAVLAVWASFGPDAGLYRVLAGVVPAFSLMQAPSRFGILAVLTLSVFTGVAVAALLARIEAAAPARRRLASLAAAALGGLVLLELHEPLSFPEVPPFERAYDVLARLPRGPVIELPVYSERFGAERTQYMLSSTVHWMPLVNAYSSHIPREFQENLGVLGGFPSREAFRVLERDGVRYAVFHLGSLEPDVRADLVARIREFSPYLRRQYADNGVWLYEIVAFPAD